MAPHRLTSRRSRFALGLRQKLILIFIATITLPVAVIGHFGYSHTTQLLSAKVEQIDREDLQSLGLTIAETMERAPQDLRFLADLHALHRLLQWRELGDTRKSRAWYQTTIATFDSFLEARGAYHQISLIDLEGNEVLRVDYDREQKEAHARAVSDLENRADSDHVLAALGLRHGDIHVSAMELEREHGEILEPRLPLVHFVTPVGVHRGDGEGHDDAVHGLLVVDLFADQILGTLQHHQQERRAHGERGQYYLVEGDGHFLFSPEGEHQFEHGRPNGSGLAQAFPWLMPHLGGRNSGFLEHEQHLVTFQRVMDSRSGEEYDWLLVKFSDRTQATAELTRFDYLFFGLFAVVLLFAWGVAHLFGGRLLNPLLEATEMLKHLARGEASTEPPRYTGHDELGDLVASALVLNDNLNTTITVADAIASGDFSHAVPIRSGDDRLGHALERMTTALRETATLAQAVAEGDFSRSVTVRSDNDQLGIALNRMTANLRRVSEIAETVAGGDFSQHMVASGRDDTLSHAINTMIANFREVVTQARAIARGDYEVTVSPSSDHDELAAALMEMTVTLRETTARNQEHSWLKNGQTELNERLRGERGLEELADAALNYLASYLKADVGAFYATRDGQQQLIGGYALRPKTERSFALGEGIVGQAVRERRALLVNDVPAGYLSIHSGLGEAAPASILATPLVYEGEVRGCIELGTFRTFSAPECAFLEQVAEGIAATLAASESRRRLQELLEETQSQAEELQAQQEELRQANEELEERTHALEERQREIRDKNTALEQAHAALEHKAEEVGRASRYKSEFLANMSHELRTPLNSLLILAQLLMENRDGNLSDKQREYARTIHNAGIDLLELINDILDLSKVEAGRIEIHPEPVHLAAVAASLEEKFRHVAEEKGLTFRIELAPGLPEGILSDHQRVEQILKNLLSNAFKFTRQGEVTLALRRDAERIAFAVRDTGIGIPADKQQLIFEAFQQADGSTSRRYGGTGLGLSISREFTRLLGGELGLASREGEGSTFTLWLPLEAARTPPLPATAEPTPAPLPEGGDPPPAKRVADDRRDLRPGERSLLIIEDDVKFARILLDLARERGFKGLIAEEGESGLHLADYYRPSAVILDIGLPGMDGWAVMQRLKDNPHTRHIPVHFISGKDQELDARKMGAIGYLIKPTGMGELGRAFAKLEHFISRDERRVLLLESDAARGEEILRLVEHPQVVVTQVESCNDARRELNDAGFDCLIFDLGAQPHLELELLQWMEAHEELRRMPVIAYAGRDLSAAENAALNRHAGNMIIKGVHSPERLLDEVTLFLHEVESTLPAEQQQMIRRVRDKDTVLHGKRVLLVDDDMRNVYALAATLEEEGLEVEVAANGRQALEQLEAMESVDLVLMDIMMPEMDGYEAMREIRKRGRFTHLPIIALTAKAMKGDKAKCIEAGASDYLSKPVEIAKLLSMLRVWLYR